jgi:cytochrome c
MRAWIASVALAAALAVDATGAVPGDPRAGEAIYARCLACHALAYDRTGPRHCGVVGRKAGGVPGFAYSEAMRRAGLTWDAATLDRFLADPMRTVPGTAMGYAGIADARERADLIAYLAAAERSDACRGASATRR